MTYQPEPTTAAEVMQRARAVQSSRNAWMDLPSAPPGSRMSLIEMSRRWAEGEAQRRHDAEVRRAEEAKRKSDAEARSISMPERVREIIKQVSDETGIPVPVIVGHRRYPDIVAARYEAIKRVAEATGWSLPRIGKVFGDRDHTSIIYALRKMGIDYRSNDHQGGAGRATASAKAERRAAERRARVERMKGWTPDALRQMREEAANV